MLLISFLLLVLNSIQSVHGFYFQEDFFIPDYNHLGCVHLKPHIGEILLKQNQDEILPYQTFISDDMEVKLCFRLCRRSIVFFRATENICICLYTVNNVYEIQHHLGNFRQGNRCLPKDLNVYSLASHSMRLISPTLTHDWSIDGCYFLNGFQNLSTRILIDDINWPRAMNYCREYCQSSRTTNYLVFFISIDKNCYCAPLNVSSRAKPSAVRKPLIHCSFLREIKSIFDKRIDISMNHSKTLVKIDVEQFCPSEFTFHPDIYSCIQLNYFENSSNSTGTVKKDSCSPVHIKTHSQLKYFSSFVNSSMMDAYLWLDKKISFIKKYISPHKNNHTALNDTCLRIRWSSRPNETIYTLVPCSFLSFPSRVFCVREPFESIISRVGDFLPRNESSIIEPIENVTCPDGFRSFNSECYFVDVSLASDLNSALKRCSNLSYHSTLVKFENHSSLNVNPSKLLGRKFQDSLLEFFYWELQRKASKLMNMSQSNSHWFRLLLGQNSSSDACCLRYFDRPSGRFLISDRCSYGGYPVCQIKPIHKRAIYALSKTAADEQTTTSFLPLLITTDSNLSEVNDTIVISPDDTTDIVVDDTDFIINATILVSTTTTINPEKANYFSFFRSVVAMITGPFLALLILLACIMFIGYYMRQIHGSYSPNSAASASSERRKRLSLTTPTSSEVSATPAVLYTRYKSVSSLIGIEADPMFTSDILTVTEETVQLIPRTNQYNTSHVEMIQEEHEEPIYAIVKDSHI